MAKNVGFFTDADFSTYVEVTMEQEATKEKEAWPWYIILIILGILVSTLLAVVTFLCLSHKRAKVISVQEDEILKKNIKDLEGKGMELPDDLKKVKTRVSFMETERPIFNKGQDGDKPVGEWFTTPKEQ